MILLEIVKDIDTLFVYHKANYFYEGFNTLKLMLQHKMNFFK